MPRRWKKVLRSVAVGVVRRTYPVAERKNWLRDAGIVGAPLAGVPADAPAVDVPDTASGAQHTGVVRPRFLDDFNHLLHELRTIELGRMPRIEGRMLSAGCADAYYFDWIESSYQRVEEHIGLELYLPKPDVLPDNVRWIENSVGQMTSVEDCSVGLVFSGQNFEHLFGDDAPDFLLESHRVLPVGGWLVIDSPHREIAAALGWSMPEHTVEFTPTEARELVELAGFDVRSVRGLWLCQDPRTGGHLPLWGEDDEAPDEAAVLRRSVAGQDDVDRCFVWWLEGQRAERAPDVAGLRRRHAQIFESAWRERQQRLRHVVGTRATEGTRTVVRVAPGVEGYAMYGPYAPLAPGTHTVSFRVRRTGSGEPEREAASLEITDMQGVALASRVVRVADLPAGEWVSFDVTARPDAVVWGAQFRVFATGGTGLDVELAVGVEETGTRTAPSFPLG